MRQDFLAFGVLLGRDRADFLEQRDVSVRFDVAADSRVAVPVPGSAEIAGLLDDPEVVHAQFGQMDARHQARQTSPQNGGVDLFVDRGAGEAGLDIGVLGICRKIALEVDILVVPVVSQARVALIEVLSTENFGIEPETRCNGVQEIGPRRRRQNSTASEKTVIVGVSMIPVSLRCRRQRAVAAGTAARSVCT